MSVNDLTFYSSWASIISLFISLVSLLYVRSIKANIVRFRRRQRLRQIVDEIMSIPDDAIPLNSVSRTKLASLKRNIPVYFYSRATKRGTLAIEMHGHIDCGRIRELKEVIDDWVSYSEDP